MEQLHERRKQVVRLHKKAIKIMQIVAMTGLSYPAVRATIGRFDAGGWPCLRPSLRGRARANGCMLTAVQAEVIQRTIGKYLARWRFTPQKPIKDAGRKILFDSGQSAATPQQNSESLGG